MYITIYCYYYYYIFSCECYEFFHKCISCFKHSINNSNKEILQPTINHLIKWIEWAIRKRNRQNLQMFQSQLTTDDDSTYMPYVDCPLTYVCTHVWPRKYKCLQTLHFFSLVIFCMYEFFYMRELFIALLPPLWLLQVCLLCVPLARESLETSCR